MITSRRNFEKEYTIKLVQVNIYTLDLAYKHMERQHCCLFIQHGFQSPSYEPLRQRHRLGHEQHVRCVPEDFWTQSISTSGACLQGIVSSCKPVLRNFWGIL